MNETPVLSNELLQTTLLDVERQLKTHPNDLQLAWYRAELLRRLRRQQEAEEAYRGVARHAAQHASERHRSFYRQTLRRQARLWRRAVAVLLILAAGVATLAWYLWPPQIPREQMAQSFSQWLAQNQGVQLLARLGQKGVNPSGEPRSLEQLLAALSEMQQDDEPEETAEEESNEASGENSGSGSGKPGQGGPAPPRCAPVQCDPDMLTGRDGPERQELAWILRTGVLLMSRHGDCAAMADTVERFERAQGWRKSEGWQKGKAMFAAGECFHFQNSLEQAQLYYRKAYCASDSTTLRVDAYLGLSGVAIRNGAKDQAHVWHSCAYELTQFARRNEKASKELLDNLINVGSNAWTWFQDKNGFFVTGKQALEVIDEMLKEDDGRKRFRLMRAKTVAHGNLLEAYIVTGRPQEFRQTFKSVMANPALEPTYQVLYRGLYVIELMLEDDMREASREMDRVAEQYQKIPEFVDAWAWDSFQVWLGEPNAPVSSPVREKIRSISEILDGPKTDAKTIQLNGIATWLRQRARG